MSNLSLGAKITVDTADVDYKLAQSTATITQELTKQQKALGLTRNEWGLLVNANNRVVEGLSAAAIKQGQWVDANAELRSSNDGFLKGVTKAQQALGFYRDKAGNLCNALGEVVERTKRVSETSRLFDGLNDGLEQVFDGIGDYGERVAELVGIQGIWGDSNSEISQQIFAMSAGVAQFAGAFKAAKDVVNFWRTLKAATDASNVSQAIANALAGNWAALAAAAAIGGVAWYATYKTGAAEVDKTAESFKNLADRAKEAGLEIRSAADVIALGFKEAFNANGLQKLAAEIDALDVKIAEQRKRAAQESESRANAARYSGQSGYGLHDLFSETEADKLGALESERTAALATFDEAAKPIIDEIAKSLETESERLERTRENYAALLAKATNPEHIATIEKAIADVDKKRDAAIRKESGIDAYLKPEKFDASDASQVAERTAEWKKLVDAGTISTEQYAAAVAKLQEEAQDATQKKEKEALDEIGYSSVEGAAAKSGKTDAEIEIAQYRDAITKAAAALDAGTISEEKHALVVADFNAAIEAATQKREKEVLDEIGYSSVEGAAKKTDKTGAEIEIDRYRDALTKAATALDAGTISQETYAVVVDDFNAAIMESQKKREDEILKTAGVSEASTGAATALEKYEAALQELTTAAITGAVDLADFDAIKKKLDANLEASTLKDLGFDELIKKTADATEKSKTADERYADAVQKYVDAFERGLISEEKKNEAVAALASIRETERAEEQKKLDEARKKEVDSTRSALGVDATMKKSQSADAALAERLQKIADAWSDAAITAQERATLIDDAYQTYYERLRKEEADAQKADETTRKAAAQENEAYKAPTSLTAGSAELYSAQIRQGDVFRSTVQKSTAQIATSAAKTYETLVSLYDAYRTASPQVWR